MRMRFLMIATMFLVATLAMGRGKNKIRYEDFDWKIYQSDHFRFHYYSAEEHLLEDVVNMSEQAYKVVSEKLQHELREPVPMIFFKTHEEFLQNNVMPGFLPRFVGAFADPYQGRMVLPVDGSPEDTFALITHELTHIFQFDMLYNNRISSIIRANTPTWFREGMASWVADDEFNMEKMHLRDIAVNGGMGSLGNVNGYMGYRVGHAAFEFMEERYGIEGVRNFLWQFRKNITGSVTAAIERAFETTIAEFDRDFRKYLRKRYIDLLPTKEEPDDFAREIRTRRTITTLSPELSPSGDLFAAIVPRRNELDLVLVSTKDGRIFRNLTKGYSLKYHEINANGYKGINDLGWKPDGNEIVFTARKEGTNRIYIVNVLNGKIKENLYFDDIRDIQAPSFDTTGNSIFFIGNKGGFYDVFRYHIADGQLKNLTADEHHDQNPKIANDGKNLLYSTQRNGFFKIYNLNLETGEKMQLTSGLGNDIQASYSSDLSSIYFSSDRFDDIYNIYELELESGSMKQYTNILTGAFSPQERVLFDHKEGQEKSQLVFTAYYQGRYRVYRMDKPKDRAEYYDVAKDNFANVKDFDLTNNIKLDTSRYGKYRSLRNFSLHGANVTVGATDDGRFLSNTNVVFSDTLGERQLGLTAYSVSSYETYQASYVDTSRRWQWGASALSLSEYIIDRYSTAVIGAERRERRYKINEASGFVRYPFTYNFRVDFGGGFTDQDRLAYVRDDANDLDLAQADYSEPFAFVGLSWDSVIYKAYGPQHGTSVDLRIREELDQNTSFSLDLRTYRELTARSLFAVRMLADYSDGDIPALYTLGGQDMLRGDYEYREFIGSRRALTQLELRFPLIDQLRFAGNIVFSDIRGAFFAEAGGSWFADDDFGFDFQWAFQDSLPSHLQDAVDDGSSHEDVDLDREYFNPDNPDPNYFIGAMGFEISMNLMGMRVHWTWAKRTNFDFIPSDSRMSFWIGHKF